MSANRARKSTGPRSRNKTSAATQPLVQRNQIASNQSLPGPSGLSTQTNQASSDSDNRGRRRLFNDSRNSNSQLRPLSSSDSEAATQPLVQRNQIASNQSLPGPSGLCTQANQASSDSDYDPDESTLQISNGRRRKYLSNQQEDTSSTDSDEVPGQERVREKNGVQKKKRKVNKPRLTPAKNKRRAARRKDSDSDYEEDEERQTSTNLLSPSQKRNLAKLVNDCVYFLLIADQKKHAIKRHEIIRHIFINQDNKLFNSVIEEANKVLKKTYGMEILVSEKRKGEYMLINCLDRDLNIQEFCDVSPIELQKRGLIFYLLTVIFMNENSINEDDLCEALKPLGVDLNSRAPHPIFGDVRKYLTTDLVKQMYVEHKCLSKDPPQFEFSWGIRAEQEVDKKDLLDFACRIMNDTKPEDWILQYKDAMAGNSTRS